MEDSNSYASVRSTRLAAREGVMVALTKTHICATNKIVCYSPMETVRRDQGGGEGRFRVVQPNKCAIQSIPDQAPPRRHWWEAWVACLWAAKGVCICKCLYL